MGTYKRRIFTLRMIIERSRAVNAKIYICFIDNQKAFDRVKHNKLMKVLDKAGIPVPDLERRLIKKLCWKVIVIIGESQICADDSINSRN